MGKLITVAGVLVWTFVGLAAFGAQVNPLESIIAGAKQEGSVSVSLHPGLAGRGIQRLGKSVLERFGVNLRIDYSPSSSYPQKLAKSIAEHVAGVPPSFDLSVFADATLAKAISAGFVEKLDWKPLLLPGTPPEVIQFDGHAISTHTNHIVLAYNPSVVSAQEAPRTLKDLANPKWRGKILLFPYTSLYLGYAIVLGTDPTLARLREISKNAPTVEIFARGLTRYMAGEYPLLLTSSGFLLEPKNRQVPIEWNSLDFSFWTTHSVVVVKGARHPNAAKLLALYLASPEGHKLMLEESGSGSSFYPDNIEHEINQQDRRRGLKVYNPIEWPGSLDYILSSEGARVERDIGRILRGR